MALWKPYRPSIGFIVTTVVAFTVVKGSRKAGIPSGKTHLNFETTCHSG